MKYMSMTFVLKIASDSGSTLTQLILYMNEMDTFTVTVLHTKKYNTPKTEHNWYHYHL